MPETPEDLVLDTSVWINLLATGCWRDILAALRCRCIVTEAVLGEIKRDPVTNLQYQRPGEPLYGIVQMETLTNGELETFIELVAAPLGDRLGDGEASAIALAAHRSATLVIDERKARRIVSERWPTLKLLRSSQLLKLPFVVDALGADKAAECYARACEIGRMHI